MDKEDALLAFERHATSKIFRPRDLFSINTFGFRGEALPSIGSVSRVVLLTNDGNTSTKVEIVQGEKVHVGPFPCNLGTDITISELFYKTPARLKHLKSPNYENSLISDIIMKFALSNPNISFVYNSDGNESFRSSGNGDLLEVIYKVYGKDVSKNSIKVEIEDFDYQVKGYMIQPQFTRSSRNAVNIFMNGRIVKPYKIQKAVIDSYYEFIPNDRYPIVVLDILMDTQLIDVNVHPSKWEVRLSKQQQLEYLIKEKCKALLSKDITPFTIDIAPVKKEKVEMITIEDFRYEPVVNNTEPQNIDEFKYEPFTNNIEVVKEEPIITPNKEVNLEVEETIIEQPTIAFPDITVIGQFHGKFILAEGEKGLYVIDQHAAQERVHFEEISEKMSDTKGHFELLIPIMLHTSNDVVRRLDELNEVIKDLNIKFEAFGDDTLIIHSVPLWLKDVEEQAFLQDLVDYFKEEKEISKLKLQRHKLATMACHRSIRFNRKLSNQEIKQVLDELKACKQPFQCPHGRPTFVLIEDYYLEREFLR